MALRFADLRLDASSLKELPDGSIRVVGQLTHSGVFSYRNPDGTERREFRPKEEVFSSEAMSTFAGAAVTVNHPRAPGGQRLVTSSNWKQVAIGHLGENVRADGDHMVGDLYVRDAEAVKQVKAGKLKHISLGYEVDFDPTPGVAPDGKRYDGVQRRIRGNHVALLPTDVPPRGGAECVLRLDAAGDEIDGDLNSPVTPEQIAALQAQVVALTSELAKARTDAADVAKLQAQVTEAQTALKAAQTQLEPARLDALVEERAALVATAKAEGVDCKGKANVAIKREIVAKKTPALATRVDSMNDDALDGVMAVYASQPHPGQKAAVAIVTEAPAGEKVAGARTDAKDAATPPKVADLRAKFLENSRAAWQSPGAISR